MAVVFLRVYPYVSHHSLGKNCRGFWNRQTFTVERWTNRRWYIWAFHCPLFILGNPFLNRRHHTEVAVCEVSALLVRWAVTRSYEIPSVAWKPEPIISSLLFSCLAPQKLAKIMYFYFRNFLCVAQCYHLKRTLLHGPYYNLAVIFETKGSKLCKAWPCHGSGG
jgi:hypothetical protein